MSGSVVEYAFNRSHQEPNTGCWLWDGCVDRAFIPMAKIARRTRSITAAVYESLGGIIGTGISVVPKCGQRACVNPDHLVATKKNRHRIIEWTRDRILRACSISENGCWNWIRPLLNGRYGASCVEGKTRSSHRMAYEVLVGPIPDGSCVLHSCDNPRCVNPSHLFLGSQSDNINDMIEKGRANFFGRKSKSSGDA